MGGWGPLLKVEHRVVFTSVLDCPTLLRPESRCLRWFDNTLLISCGKTRPAGPAHGGCGQTCLTRFPFPTWAGSLFVFLSPHGIQTQLSSLTTRLPQPVALSLSNTAAGGCESGICVSPRRPRSSVHPCQQQPFRISPVILSFLVLFSAWFKSKPV